LPAAMSTLCAGPTTPTAVVICGAANASATAPSGDTRRILPSSCAATIAKPLAAIQMPASLFITAAAPTPGAKAPHAPLPASVDTAAAGDTRRTLQPAYSATNSHPNRGEVGFPSNARPLGLLKRATVPTASSRAPSVAVGGGAPAKVVTAALFAAALDTSMRRTAWLKSAKKSSDALSGLMTR
jgi:hypothetical protein